VTAGPSLDLDWELGLYQVARALWRRFVGDGQPPPSASAIEVDPLRERLSTFASVLAARPVRLETTRHAGGLRGATLLLPAQFDPTDDPSLNQALLLLRVAIDATTIGRGPTLGAPAHQEAWASMVSLGQELPRFAELTRAGGAALIARHPADAAPLHPSLRALWAMEPPPAEAPPPDHGVLWGRVLSVELPDQAAAGDGDAPPSGESSEFDALDVTDITVRALGEEDEFEVPLHSFEKVELLESFNGHLRQLDGDDDLAAHLEALEEVDLSTMLRGGPRAHSLLRAEVGLEADIPDAEDVRPDDRAVHYPEWDHRRGAYRPDWCAVYPTVLPAMAPSGAAAESLRRQRRSLGEVTASLLRQRQRRRRRHRLPDGDALDIDAVVDAVVDLSAGRSPARGVYSRLDRHQRDVATTILVDISLSADSWVDGRRVWDVTRDALWVYGEAAHTVGDDLQILAFASHTRHRIRTYTVLDWQEPWSVGKHRLEQLTPQGYTRIGPALRHATAELLGRRARARQLVLISDCKPTDYDRYEGTHGLRDVRRALEEARAAGVATYGLAVDDVAKQRLPSMFGAGGWSLLRVPEDLGTAVGRMSSWRRL